MKIQDVMTKNPASLTPAATVRDAAGNSCFVKRSVSFQSFAGMATTRWLALSRIAISPIRCIAEGKRLVVPRQ